MSDRPDVQEQLAYPSGPVTDRTPKNVEGMTGLSDTPFRYRNQSWESAPDGSGFVLRNVEDRVANSPEELRALLEDVSARVQVEDPAPVQNAP